MKMNNSPESHFVFDALFNPTYDAVDMAVVRERKLIWMESYQDTELNRMLSILSETAQREIKQLKEQARNIQGMSVSENWK